MSEHSPEPWKWMETGPIDAHIVAADGTEVVGGEASEGYVEEDDPNIQRIVACVNALAGVEDPETWVRRAKVAVEAFGAGLEEFADEPS